MDEDRFERLLAAYGAEAARWPEAERLAALRYLAATPAAHARRAEARRLDQRLDAWSLAVPPAGLAAGVVASARLARIFRPRTLWLSAAGLAAASVVGLVVGAGVANTAQKPQPTSDPAVTAALDGASEFTPSLDAGQG